MKSFVTTFALLSAITLTGCESAEDRQARREQFNGMPLAQVAVRIGAPNSLTPTSAVWHHKYAMTQRIPVYGGGPGGKQRILYYRTQEYIQECTFTATLSVGTVVASDYKGNDCRRYAPKQESPT